MEHFTIATVAEQSADFRRVLWTGEHTQRARPPRRRTDGDSGRVSS
jgi:hypothetical protein